MISGNFLAWKSDDFKFKIDSEILIYIFLFIVKQLLIMICIWYIKSVYGISKWNAVTNYYFKYVKKYILLIFDFC